MGRSFFVLGTPLQACDYAGLTVDLQARSMGSKPFAVDFTNTHIVTMRRRQPEFSRLTSCFDYFIPDGMPLVWCLNRQGAKMCDRVYGPTFMRKCLLGSLGNLTHYFLGGDEECVNRLKDSFLKQNPALNIVGVRNGYFNEEQEPEILEEIIRLSPHFIWVGLGTPKQQEWVAKYKDRLRRGVVLAVGFAFDVNAGTKPDAPDWMQRWGMTWVYRICSEPRRLATRYLRYNSLFLFFLFWDGLRGLAWRDRELAA